MVAKRLETTEKTIHVRFWTVKCILPILAGCMISFRGHAADRVTPNDPLPTKVLTCGGSIITAIGPRLEGDVNLSMGYQVSFKNGGDTIDYNTPKAVRESKVGDHVFICLVNVPKDCSSDYSYNRVYTVTNLRTLHSWSAGNAVHDYCGAPQQKP